MRLYHLRLVLALTKSRSSSRSPLSSSGFLLFASHGPSKSPCSSNQFDSLLTFSECAVDGGTAEPYANDLQRLALSGPDDTVNGVGSRCASCTDLSGGLRCACGGVVIVRESPSSRSSSSLRCTQASLHVSQPCTNVKYGGA